MKLEELLIEAKKIIITEKQIQDLKSKLKKEQELYESNNKITQKFLNRTYSI